MKTARKESGVIKIYSQGGPYVMIYEQEIVPSPAYGQVLIEQEAISVNFVDTMFRDGTFPLNSFPSGAGVEAAGTISDVGPGVSDFKPGDKVVYRFALGAYAQRRVVGTDTLVHYPSDITAVQAAAMHAKGLTAHVLLSLVYQVKAGDIVLVHAAAGGVGSLLTKWAKSIGAFVIGTVGTAAKKGLVKGLDGVITLDTEDLESRVLEITGGKKVDVLYDGVGNATFDRSLGVIKNGGTAVLFGGSSGYPAVSKTVLGQKGIDFIQVDINSYIQSRQHLEQLTKEVYDQFREGVFGEFSSTDFPLSQAADAHRKLENRETTGPIILIP